MKAIKTILLIGFCLTMSMGVKLNAQDTSDNTIIVNRFNAQKELATAFNTMLKNATLNNWKDNKPCKAKDLVDLVDKSKLKLNTHELHSIIGHLFTTIYATPTADAIEQGSFASLTDKALNALSNSNNFAEFVKIYTGKNVADIKGKIEFRGEILYKDIDILREYYQNLKELTSDYKYNIEQSVNDQCGYKTTNSIKVKSIDYPNITWDIKTIVNVDCICSPDFDVTEIKSGSYEYSATITGTIKAAKLTFDAPQKAKISILTLECCGDKKEEPPYEDPVAALNENGINDLMQNQTIGFGAGIGFGQDFEETTFCLTAEYLYQINADEYNGWYIGGEVSHHNTSFGDFSSNKTVAGGKLQYNISAVPSGETQFVAGLMANYAFGNTDNNGFEDDFTGTIFCAYGGVNIRVSDNWSVGAQFPVLIFENYTFKPEGGGEFKTDATSLFINKDNPLKIVVRRSF